MTKLIQGWYGLRSVRWWNNGNNMYGKYIYIYPSKYLSLYSCDYTMCVRNIYLLYSSRQAWSPECVARNMIIDTSLMQRFIRVIIEEHTVLGSSRHLNARAVGTDDRLLWLLLAAPMNGVVDEVVELKLLPALDDTTMMSNGSEPDDGVLGNCAVVGETNCCSNGGGGGRGGGGGEQRRLGRSARRSSWRLQIVRLLQLQLRAEPRGLDSLLVGSPNVTLFRWCWCTVAAPSWGCCCALLAVVNIGWSAVGAAAMVLVVGVFVVANGSVAVVIKKMSSESFLARDHQLRRVVV